MERPLDVATVLAPLVRGAGDPTLRLGRGVAVRTSWMASGASTLRVRWGAATRLELDAWGPGADEALERATGLLGLDDDDSGFDPSLHPLVAELARRRGRPRLGRTGSVIEVLVPAILEQKITGTEAFRSYRRLVRALGIPAPVPDGGEAAPIGGEAAQGPPAREPLWMPPRAADLAALRPWTFPGLGIEPRRGALLQRVARDGDRLERLAAAARLPGGGGAGATELATRLRAYPGIGPWTAAEVTLRALGDPDAVSLADAHLPSLVAWVLAGEARGTDERMLELLAPWTGHRARVIRLLETSGRAAPRFGPRIAPRDLLDLAPRRG
ncbi:MAG TPA: hypothetical protein VFW20_10065 [Candidatus Limnocylindrales bacterium]|nr:hypothetical protein [Candidatus Limnocylindrales bacterium]